MLVKLSVQCYYLQRVVMAACSAGVRKACKSLHLLSLHACNTERFENDMSCSCMHAQASSDCEAFYFIQYWSVTLLTQQSLWWSSLSCSIKSCQWSSSDGHSKHAHTWPQMGTPLKALSQGCSIHAFETKLIVNPFADNNLGCHALSAYVQTP